MAPGARHPGRGAAAAGDRLALRRGPRARQRPGRRRHRRAAALGLPQWRPGDADPAGGAAAAAAAQRRRGRRRGDAAPQRGHRGRQVLMRGAALLLLLLAGACAEMRQPAPPPGPLSLRPGAGAPPGGASGATRRAFVNRGAGLAGHPAEAAEAVAQLEYLTAEVTRNPRFAPLPESLRREMLLARSEVRDALGINP